MSDLDLQTQLRFLLNSEKLTDVLVSGFIARNQSKLEFRPMFWWLYARFATRYLLCQSVNQWFLKLDIVNEIIPAFEVETDEFCVASIKSAVVFNSHLPHKVTAFEYLADSDCDFSEGLVKTGGFHFESGETLFFDPSADSGIRIGSKEQVYRWTSLLHSPMQNYQEKQLDL